MTRRWRRFWQTRVGGRLVPGWRRDGVALAAVLALVAVLLGTGVPAAGREVAGSRREEAVPWA